MSIPVVFVMQADHPERKAHLAGVRQKLGDLAITEKMMTLLDELDDAQTFAGRVSIGTMLTEAESAVFEAEKDRIFDGSCAIQITDTRD